MTERSRNAIATIVPLVLFSIIAGALYGSGMAREDKLVGLFRGGLTGAVIGSLIGVLEVVALRGPFGAFLKAQPFLVNVIIRSLIYLVLILIGLIVGSLADPTPDTRPGILLDVTLGDILFSFAASVGVNFILAINNLLGQNVLLNFLTGRYHQPKLEKRVLLSIDMKDSTAIAERLGAIEFHRLMNRYYRDLTGPIVERRGRIHKYVGDEMIVTWPAETGLSDGRCVLAALDAKALLQKLAPIYRQEFGVQPDFRASLHLGEVVSGEMGDVRKEIVYLGDAMNTVSRLLEACRLTGSDVVATAPLVAHLPPNASLSLQPIDAPPLRGKSERFGLFAVSRKAAA